MTLVDCWTQAFQGVPAYTNTLVSLCGWRNTCDQAQRTKLACNTRCCSYQDLLQQLISVMSRNHLDLKWLFLHSTASDALETFQG